MILKELNEFKNTYEKDIDDIWNELNDLYDEMNIDSNTIDQIDSYIKLLSYKCNYDLEERVSNIEQRLDCIGTACKCTCKDD